MNTIVIKRSININGNKTSVSLENEFWDALHEIAESKNTTTAQLVGEIARQRTTVNLSSALRVYAYRHFRSLEGSRHLGSATPYDRPPPAPAPSSPITPSILGPGN